jgi:hypothetical protein
LGCGKGYFGRYYNPAYTEKNNIIYPVLKYEKQKIKKMKTSTGQTIFNVEATTIKSEKYHIENNYTKPAELLPLNCNSPVCKHCRRIIQGKVFQNSIREVNQNNIEFHWITTFGEDRTKHGYEESYKIMAYEMKKIFLVINYTINKIKKGKLERTKNKFMYNDLPLPDHDFSYIDFVRSQNHPTKNNPIGYCHHHTGLNYPINNKWIQEIREKNHYKIGFTKIIENSNFTEYLLGDFFDDEEWIIPLNKRHYNTSKNIHLNIGGTVATGILYKNPSYEFIDKDLWKNHNTTMPFEEYIKWYYDILEKIKNQKEHEKKVFLNNFKDTGLRHIKTGEKYYLRQIKKEVK